uniref:Fic family protein n=1 Tax=uncultured Thiotrichaceae bacterium TaxID=298394 RepID=A0A6S6UNZ3_9GAMM|nr:MAG: Fic family protein [uncultured Thiotrichaceae bacterium]
MHYIWQHPNWPTFTYSTAAISAKQLYPYAQSIGRLTTQLISIPEDLRLDAIIDLMVKEAITTSAIEGENLNTEDVRSSLKNHLGLTHPPQHVRDPRAQGISALLVSNYKQTAAQLDAEILFRWHRMVLPNEYDSWGRKLHIGQWRKESMQVISGPPHKQKIHFEAPPADMVDAEMEKFFQWYNQTSPQNNPATGDFMPGPVRAAIAHLWFVTIHPFDDGNGRIARALSEHALAQDARQPVLHSLSTAIEQDRKSYYDQLEAAQRGTLDIDQWIMWFVNITRQATTITERTLTYTVQKTNFMQAHNPLMNERQQRVVLDLFSNGADGDPRSVNRNKYVKLIQCSPSTALRDLKDLVDKSILIQLPGLGRNTRYGLNLMIHSENA